MYPWRRVWMSALVLAALAAVALAVQSSAQTYEDARSSAQLSPDPLLRSPRLLGLGRLELVVDDEHTRFTMWDFAGNPTGIYAADSGSTFELRPRTASSSSVDQPLGPESGAVRQTFAARDAGVGFEAWRRGDGVSAFGFIGELSSLRLDSPYSQDTELRQAFRLPSVQGIVSGPLPGVHIPRMRFALRVHYAAEARTDQFRQVVSNPTGQWLDRDGNQVNPPVLFTPDDVRDNRLGGGAALSYDFGSALAAAAGYDLVQHRIRSENSGNRYFSQVGEDRPYQQGQLSMVGRLGPHLQYGVDGRGWTVVSEGKYLFTISAGARAIPFTGRGISFTRDEEGTALRGRARWTQGGLRLGAGLTTGYRQVKMRAPGPDDVTSYNYFLRNTLYYHFNTDTLAVPDSIADVITEQRSWEASGGLAWTRLPHHAQAGVEFHTWQDLSQNDIGGLGPKALGWDVRSGLEVPLNPVVTVRGGYIYRWEDRDDFTRMNEYVTHSMTLGLGLRPARADWAVESGYVIDFVQADFGDPAVPRSARQQLAAQIRWEF